MPNLLKLAATKETCKGKGIKYQLWDKACEALNQVYVPKLLTFTYQAINQFKGKK